MKKSVLLFSAGILLNTQFLAASGETAVSVKPLANNVDSSDWSITQSALSDQIGFLSDFNLQKKDARLHASTTRLPLSRSESHQASLSLRLDKLDHRNGTQRRGWYVFAGADDEALTLSGLTGADIELRDHVTVGDVHVGLSFPAGDGQAALGYARRSVEYQTQTLSATVEEDVLGLSYGLKF